MGDDWVDVGARDGKEHAKKAFEAELARGAKENWAKRGNGAHFQGETQREAPKADRWKPPPEDNPKGHGGSGARGKAEASPTLITPSPFKWRDPASIPKRQFVYGTHYIRKYVSSTLAPGAAGKTSLGIVELLAICTGRPLLGITPAEQCNVWLWNGEDPRDELERKIHATMLLHRIKPEEVEGRLFFDSGREQKIIIAQQTKDGTIICTPAQENIIRMLKERQIGVFSVDPFLRSHRVNENDNAAMDEAASAWCEVANEAGAAIALYQHTRKTNGDEVTVEDSRGAIALPNASRDVRTLNPMTKAEAEEADIDPDRRRFYFRVTNGGKSNLTPPAEKSDWYHFASVELGNGDNVGAVEKWTWPSLFADVATGDLYRVQKRISEADTAKEFEGWRESDKAKDWAGRAVAEILDYDLSSQSAKRQIKKMLATWIKNKALKVVERNDHKRMKRKWIEVGVWATDLPQ